MTTDTTTRHVRPGHIAAPGPLPVLAGLVAVDPALIAVSVLRLATAGPSLTDPWLLETDRGVAEHFGYTQQALLVVLLPGLCLLTRHLVWGPTPPSS